MPDDASQAKDDDPDASPPTAQRVAKKPRASASDAAPPKPAESEKSLQAKHARDIETASNKHRLEEETKDADNRRKIELMMGGGVFLAMVSSLVIPFMPNGDGQKIAGGIVGAVVTGCLGYLAGRHGGGKG